MNFDALNYYKILNCPLDASDKLIKISYRDCAKFWHPDHNKSPDALEQFQKISLAYNILSDHKTRLVYDLLSLIYTADNFPDMKTLKIYQSADGHETPFLRVFKLTKVYPGLSKGRSDEQNLIGTFNDAVSFIKQITMHNWLKGWWSPKGFKLVKTALKNNYAQINKNRDDNFKMLIHNTAAYTNADKNDKARLSLVQALEYSDSKNYDSVQYFLNKFPEVKTEIPHWDYEYLKKIQLRFPKLMGSIIGIFALIGILLTVDFDSSQTHDKIAYYQQVRFNSGSETVDDVIVAKIFNIPVDVTDTKMLYHLTDRTRIMHGPSEEFDILDTGRLGQTVRVTGYSPDKSWYRVMLDNGEMGFIKKEYIKPGIGRDIPKDSKIFYNPALQN